VLSGHAYANVNAICLPVLFHHHANEYDVHRCADGNGYVPS